MADSKETIKCVFCVESCETKLRLLNCSHGICKDCCEKEMKNESLQCKLCLDMTFFGLVENNEEASGAKSKYIMCNEPRCYIKAKKNCILCKKAYCDDCAKEHCVKKNHDLKAVMPYPCPMEREAILCTICRDEFSQISCVPCGLIMCSFCCIKINHDVQHKHKVMKDYRDEICISDRTKEKTELLIRNMMRINISLAEQLPIESPTSDEVTEALLDKEIEKINYDFDDFNHENM